MRLILATAIVIHIVGAPALANEPKKKSSWLKSLGKKTLENKSAEETSSPVIGTRGFSEETGNTCGSENAEPCQDVTISTTTTKRQTPQTAVQTAR